MATIRPCPSCGGGHKKKTTAKACAIRHGGGRPWTKKELGL